MWERTFRLVLWPVLFGLIVGVAYGWHEGNWGFAAFVGSVGFAVALLRAVVRVLAGIYSE